MTAGDSGRAVGEGAERLAGGEYFVGLMSGTSCDGLDAVLLEIDRAEPPAWRVVSHVQRRYPDAFRSRLWGLEAARADEICRLNREIAEASVAAVGELLAAAAVGPSQVAAIGSHGHTACHLAGREPDSPSTLQLGDGSLIAIESGIVTVSDFRAADVAVSGQGAPLVPAADAILFARYLPATDLVVLNLGGIANITVLPRRGRNGTATDTGPGVMVIDSLARRSSAGRLACDLDGGLARRGRALPHVLEFWLQHPFFERSTPRTAGREDFGESWTDETLARFPTAGWEDLVRTAVEWTAVAVERAVSESVAAPGEVWLAGGGARHPVLVERLASRLRGWQVEALESRVPLTAETREAAAFAVLARETLAGRPGNWPEATGARRPVLLGKVSYPAGRR